MYQIKSLPTFQSKMARWDYRLFLFVSKLVFSKPDRFLHFLKSLGCDDIFCTNALEYAFAMPHIEAKKLIFQTIERPFVNK